MAKAKLGTGKRFASLQSKVEKEGYGAKTASKIAALAGRKAHGEKMMEKLSALGKKKSK